MFKNFIFGGDITKSRISRRTFIISTILLCLLSVIIYKTLFSVFSFSFLLNPFTELAYNIIYVGVFSLIAFKRLHDRDKGFIWLLSLFIAPVVVNSSINMFVHLGSISRASPLYEIVNILILISILWVLVECVFFKGTIGQNRFGEDPLQKTVAVV